MHKFHFPPFPIFEHNADVALGRTEFKSKLLPSDIQFGSSRSAESSCFCAGGHVARRNSASALNCEGTCLVMKRRNGYDNGGYFHGCLIGKWRLLIIDSAIDGENKQTKSYF